MYKYEEMISGETVLHLGSFLFLQFLQIPSHSANFILDQEDGF